MNILVTGSNGFIGKNLIAWLKQLPDVRVLEFDQQHTLSELAERLAVADLIYHLAGVNRPQSVDEFRTGNVDLTAYLCDRLIQNDQPVPIVLSSSIQAALDNPYGVSKRQAEEVVTAYAQRCGAPSFIYRLNNVFGKWCRPNYNSVVATFCHNIAHDLPITISNPSNKVPLVHVDDVVQAFIAATSQLTTENRPGGIDNPPSTIPNSVSYREVGPVYTVTLGQLAALIRSFRQSRQTLQVPNFADEFTRKLYGTYLSYLAEDDFAFSLEKRCDLRGCLAEFVKSTPFGQIFVSRTNPGVTRGNHYHHTKTEKFLVLEGEAIIRFRRIQSEVRGQRSEVGGQRAEGGEEKSEVIEYQVSGKDFRVLDIPPGYTHSIENIGEGELVTLFWASEMFDPERSDTFWEEV